MHHLLITTDLHQHRGKWDVLIKTVEEERPEFVLIAGDILPKYGDFGQQRQFFRRLRNMLNTMRDQTGARVLLYLCNDDGHFLEPLVDELAADGLCVNLNQRVFRENGLVFCGMNKVRDYPFGYKHYCVPDGNWIADPIQFCGQGLTLDDQGNLVEIPDLRLYLLGKRSLLEHLRDLMAQLEPGEMGRSVWMVHQPPASLGMDVCGNGKRVGSPTLLQFIEENQPLLGCSGHIHESPHQPGGRWLAQVGRTTWIQPGQVDDRLHYVTLDITGDYIVANVRHSVFGEP
jgi:Icc-related predicted phosphoesterase